MLTYSLNQFQVQLERSQLAEGLIKSNQEIEKLLAENSKIHEMKIKEMRDMLKKYQNEKDGIEKKYSQQVNTLEVTLFIVSYLLLFCLVFIEGNAEGQ